MLPVAQQVAEGRLVCPISHRRLRLERDRLVVEGNAVWYPYVDGVPRLLPDAERREVYRQEAGGQMVEEYSRGNPRGRVLDLVDRILAGQGDFRSEPSLRAFEAVASRGERGGLCLSVGGGPRRVDERLVNLNVDAFDNVDVVGDAYALPYADGGVDGIHCEAVLEHLEYPEVAVGEMSRVLPPGGEAYVATPFLQAFHAYPNHFQNFTLEGHDRLFRRHGFEIVSSGACVGPTFALTDLAALYLRDVFPGGRVGRAAAKVAALGFLGLRPLDRRLLRRPEAHRLASTVYAHLRKPLLAGASVGEVGSQPLSLYGFE